MYLLLLGNSGVQAGHTLVGVNLETGEWLRLMTKHLYGQFRHEDTGTGLPYLGYRTLRSLDVLDVTLGGRCPELGYTECVYLETMKYQGTWNTRDNFSQLEKYVDHNWGNSTSRSSWLIKVIDPEFYIDRHEMYADARCKFNHNGINYDLRVSDHAQWIKDARNQENEPIDYPKDRTWYFTISLAVTGRGDPRRVVSAIPF